MFCIGIEVVRPHGSSKDVGLPHLAGRLGRIVRPAGVSRSKPAGPLGVRDRGEVRVRIRAVCSVSSLPRKCSILPSRMRQ